MAESRILLVDNRDSFTMNLAQIIRETPGVACDIVRHDNIRLEEIGRYAGIIFSPGPGLPHEFPEMFSILDRYAGQLPILGVCLGHQAIAGYFGARLINLPHPHHGQRVPLEIVGRDEPLFADIPDGSAVGLYHSWAVDAGTLPPHLRITARWDGLVMALRHTTFDIRGVQFHPESYMTEYGRSLMANWLTSVTAASVITPT